MRGPRPGLEIWCSTEEDVDRFALVGPSTEQRAPSTGAHRPHGLGTRLISALLVSLLFLLFAGCARPARNPQAAQERAALGEAARQRGDDRQAAEQYAAAVELDPDLVEGYLHAANAFSRMQNYRRARPLALEYARRAPEDWRGPFLLGMISSGEGQMEEALRHYEEAVRRAPGHAPAYLNAGATYLYGPATPERLAAAADWFERGVALAPRYAELHYYLGLVRYRQERWQEAAAALRRAVELRPALLEAYYPLAQSLRRLGREREAAICLKLHARMRAERRETVHGSPAEKGKPFERREEAFPLASSGRSPGEDVSPTPADLLSEVGGEARRSLPPSAATPVGGVRFTDVTEAAGLRFRHVTGATGRKYLPETMGAGCAFFDVDDDGRLDILLLNGRPLEKGAGETGPTAALYRNVGDGTFADVTAGSGLDVPLYAMGCAVGDYDGDGRLDLYVSTCLDGGRLFRNVGGGKFRDVTRVAGLDDRGWGTSAAWVDYDRDGRLDLFVCRYVRYRLGESDRGCTAPDGTRMYCDPRRLPPDTCRLYRNEGVRFRDVSSATGIASRAGKALGVAVGDVDDDGWPDLFVANDTEPNFLFHNRQGRFVEIGLESGVAMPENGEPRAGMGIDLADVLNDGRLALVTSNFSGEGLAYYQQESPRALLFTERAFAVGLGVESLNLLGFGLAFFDFDNDGLKDLYVANGHIQPDVHRYSAGATYAQRPLLFRNTGDGRFTEVGRAMGGPMAREAVRRGLAVGDFDNDGDLDLLVTQNGGPAELLRNDGGARRYWLQLRLLSGGSIPTEGVGARVTLRAGSLVQRRLVRTGSSYLSQSDTRLHFGLGRHARVDSVEIRWPDGRVSRLTDLPADRLVTVRPPSR